LFLEAVSAGGDDMWIDRVKINSNNEIAITDLNVSTLGNLVACDLAHQTLSVGVTNNVNQDLDFSETPVTIVLEVSGPVTQTYTKTLTTGSILAHQQDSYEIESDFDYSTSGSYYFKAYVNSIDNYPNNDTMIKVMDILPDVKIDSIVDIGCEVVGVSVYKKVYIKNVGNLAVHNIPLRLQVDGANDVTETAAITLAAGQKVAYTFATPYTVPASDNYTLTIKTELPCDIDNANDELSINCCVIEPQVKVTQILDPSASSCDLINTQKFVTLTVDNTSGKMASNQEIIVVVDDTKGNVVTLKDNATLLPGTTNYRFTKSYTVPNLTEGTTYDVTAYIYAEAYGKTIHPCVKTDVSVPVNNQDLWAVGQNIPNPVQALTSIPFSIPEDGTVRFTLMSVNGQVLYMEDIQAKSGSHIYDFNTLQLSNGIYYYSMEYVGQKIVKKMTVQK
jgi:hypothetical protein